jgi:hypothetical protein
MVYPPDKLPRVIQLPNDNYVHIVAPMGFGMQSFLRTLGWRQFDKLTS